tara:strand:- start:905 stop:1357 length:453 start_codon:yes stop_codon:yes gene_type:complete
MKTIIWISIILFLTQCGYTALYKNNTNQNIKISSIDMRGDNDMNNLIKTELKNYFYTVTNNEYGLKIETNYQKEVNTKDATGKPLEFRLELITNVNIIFGDENIETVFNESFNIANSSDTFELRKYEDTIKKNFAKSTKDKIILKLISLK